MSIFDIALRYISASLTLNQETGNSFKCNIKLLKTLMDMKNLSDSMDNVKSILNDRMICPRCAIEMKNAEIIKCDNCGARYGKREGFYDFFTNT